MNHSLWKEEKEIRKMEVLEWKKMAKPCGAMINVTRKDAHLIALTLNFLLKRHGTRKKGNKELDSSRKCMVSF